MSSSYACSINDFLQEGRIDRDCRLGGRHDPLPRQIAAAASRLRAGITHRAEHGVLRRALLSSLAVPPRRRNRIGSNSARISARESAWNAATEGLD
jgi:hypothetical protein